MRYGSLFSGILGLDLAVEAFGHEPAWFCEFDRNPRKVIERHRPGVSIYEDVTELNFTQVEPVDLLVGGGFPCPPFSDAGMRLGEGDSRYLWPPVARAVRTLRPRIVVLEQVAAFVRYPREFGRTIGDLAEIGYRVRWCCLRASDVAAPHRRERWFCVAHAGSSGWGGSGSPDPEHEVSRDLIGNPPQDQQHKRSGRKPRSESDGNAIPDTQPSGLQGIAQRRLGGTGFASPSGQDATDPNGRRLQERSQRDGIPSGGLEAPRRDDANGCHEAPTDPSSGRRKTRERDLRRGQPDTSWGTYEPAIRRWERIVGPAPAPLIDAKLSHHFVTWMMGLPQDWTEPLSRTAALKALGNAVVPQQAIAALQILELPTISEQFLAQRERQEARS